MTRCSRRSRARQLERWSVEEARSLAALSSPELLKRLQNVSAASMMWRGGAIRHG